MADKTAMDAVVLVYFRYFWLISAVISMVGLPFKVQRLERATQEGRLQDGDAARYARFVVLGFIVPIVPLGVVSALVRYFVILMVAVGLISALVAGLVVPHDLPFPGNQKIERLR